MLLTSAPAQGTAPHSAYADSLVNRARSIDLASREMWHNLVAYRPNLTGGYTSEADSANFFLAANGRTDPQAELEATIRAFFRPAPARIKGQHPQCAFVARFHWLAEKLDFDRKRLTRRGCPQFEAWFKEINPQSLALVFPAAYLNNPSSMFGHTLLRIDPPTDSGAATTLTSYAINFAAQTTDNNGVLFAIRGLTGLYAGRYSVRPYYEMVKDYSEIESRDIWEYELNLTASEVGRLLRHAWEMDQVSFAYYFFDENCSYQLLRLLEVARPGLDLRSEFFYQVIPSDTVKSVTQHGLLKDVTYRPALLTRVRHRLNQLPSSGRPYVAALATGETMQPPPQLAPDERALALETAYDLVKYYRHDGAIDRATYAKRSLQLLWARSQLPRGRSTPPAPAPDTAPHRGHDSARLNVDIGRSDSTNFAQLGVRAAYHGLTERPAGYTPGAQIAMFEAQLRDYAGRGVELESAILADILSLAPRGPLIKPLSWRVRAGYRRVWLDASRSERVWVLEGGAGPAWQLGDVTAYTFVQGQVLADSDLPGDYSLGAGARLGALWSISSDWHIQAWLEGHAHAGDLDRTLLDANLELTYAIDRNLALHAQTSAFGRPGTLSDEVSAGLRWYF